MSNVLERLQNEQEIFQQKVLKKAERKARWESGLKEKPQFKHLKAHDGLGKARLLSQEGGYLKAVAGMRKFICPHCGAICQLGGNVPHINKHFAYCSERNTTMSEQQLIEVIEAAPAHLQKNILLNEYGTFILSHNELLTVMSTIALNRAESDNMRGLAIKLLNDYHMTVRNDPDRAEQLGFSGFEFDVITKEVDQDKCS